LEINLRNQILPLDATWVESTLYGHMYEIRSQLRGPNGLTLMVRTFWMTEIETGQTKFITLYPERSS